jgi:fructoselysine-6-P-deglycase FrlB-like protein
MVVLLFAGAGRTLPLNRRLFDTICGIGARAVWLDSPPSPIQEERLEGKVFLPRSSGVGLPLAEIVPIQLLAAHLASQSGLVPGEFLHSGKITLEE